MRQAKIRKLNTGILEDNSFKKNSEEGLPQCPVVKMPLQGAQVQSLVRELSSPRGAREGKKKIKKRKKAEFLLEEKEMSSAELDPTHTKSATVSKERESLILNTEHLNILINQCSAWLCPFLPIPLPSNSLPTLSVISSLPLQQMQPKSSKEKWKSSALPTTQLNSHTVSTPQPCTFREPVPPCCPSRLSPSHS